MTRREARELAFILLFEKTFTEEPVSEILQRAGEARDVEGDAFSAVAGAGGGKPHRVHRSENCRLFLEVEQGAGSPGGAGHYASGGV